MKNTPAKTHKPLVLVISHSFLAAILTSPYVISVYCDIFNIITSTMDTHYSPVILEPKALVPFSFASMLFAIIAIVATVLYFLRKQAK